MIVSRESIVRDALQLPENERVRVIQELLESLSSESDDLLDDAWPQELDRRFAEWESDPSTSTLWSVLKTQR